MLDEGGASAVCVSHDEIWMQTWCTVLAAGFMRAIGGVQMGAPGRNVFAPDDSDERAAVLKTGPGSGVGSRCKTRGEDHTIAVSATIEPRRSARVTHLCSVKVIHTKNTVRNAIRRGADYGPA